MPSRPATERGLLVPWAVLAVLCLGLMLAFPGGETVAYHVGWIALGLAYGIHPWPLRWAVTAVVVYSLVTGVVLVDRALRGVIALEETTEVPLMAMLVMCMIWHVNDRLKALDALDAVRRVERDRAARRERMAGMVSHEIKTTVTIASGYLDLVVARTPPSATRDDAEIARDELHRLTRASERLIRMMRMQEEFAPQRLDGDEFMGQVLERWAPVAERTWQLDSEVGWFDAAPGRLRACFDTLIENSLRHTVPGGTIRLVGRRTGNLVCIGVADSGTGIPLGQLDSINHHGLPALDPAVDDSRNPRTGLGLTIVHEVVREHAGRLTAGRSAEGGALVLMLLPDVTEPAASQPPRAPHTADVASRVRAGV